MNGIKIRTIEYINGIIHGEYKTYNHNGELKECLIYVNGEIKN